MEIEPYTAITVYCDMTTEDGGWTSFAYSQGSITVNKTWTQYEQVCATFHQKLYMLLRDSVVYRNESLAWSCHFSMVQQMNSIQVYELNSPTVHRQSIQHGHIHIFCCNRLQTIRSKSVNAVRERRERDGEKVSDGATMVSDQYFRQLIGPVQLSLEHHVHRCKAIPVGGFQIRESNVFPQI